LALMMPFDAMGWICTHLDIREARSEQFDVRLTLLNGDLI
jgi:hypothetical protein